MSTAELTTHAPRGAPRRRGLDAPAARVQDDPGERPAPAGSRLRRPGPAPERPQHERPAQPRSGCYHSGRLAGTGYVSILPGRPGHRALGGASFAPNPLYFDPENLVRLAIEGGCNAVASTLGVLGATSPQVRAQVPLHRQAQPQRAAELSERVRPDHVRQRAARVGAWARRASARRSTSARRSRAARSSRSRGPSRRPTGSGCSPCCGATCATRRSRSTASTTTSSADLTGQANHLGVTIEADIIKQKLPENNGGYNALNVRTATSYGKTSELVYSELTTDNPIDLTRYQLANCYMGRAGLINSGGASSGESDLAEAVRTAVINKRAGGTGLISGRKAFQRPMDEGIGLLQRDPGRLPGRRGHDRLTAVTAPRRACNAGCIAPGVAGGCPAWGPARCCACWSSSSPSWSRPTGCDLLRGSGGGRRRARGEGARRADRRRGHDPRAARRARGDRCATSAWTRRSRSSRARRCSASRRRRARRTPGWSPGGACASSPARRPATATGACWPTCDRASDGVFVNAALVRDGYARHAHDRAERPLRAAVRGAAGATRARRDAGCGAGADRSRAPPEG